MTFACQICDPPFLFEEEEDENRSGLLYFVGNDQSKGHTYFIYVYLRYYAEQDPEYGFGVLQRDVNTDEQVFLQEAQIARKLFNQEERLMVLFVILQATSSLLRWKKPARVFRCTNDWNPPEKALRKHNMVSWIFTAVGYTVRRTDQYDGNRMWLAELNE